MDIVESKKDDNRLIYQQFNMELEDEKFYGAIWVWYSKNSKRVYAISVMKEDNRALELFEKTLKSFKEE